MGRDGEAFEKAKGDLAERLLAALEAAQAEGGDIRGKQSAAIVIVTGKPTGKPWADRLFDLRVEDHPEPVDELKRLVKLHRAYTRMNAGDELFSKNDIAGAVREYGAAEALVPDNIEMVFWHAVTLANANKVEESLPLFKRVFAADGAWATLSPAPAEIEAAAGRSEDNSADFVGCAGAIEDCGLRIADCGLRKFYNYVFRVLRFQIAD